MSICGLRTFGEGAGFPFPARIAGGRFGRGNDVVALDALHCRKMDIRGLTRFRNSGRKNVRAFMTRTRPSLDDLSQSFVKEFYYFGELRPG